MHILYVLSVSSLVCVTLVFLFRMGADIATIFRSWGTVRAPFVDMTDGALSALVRLVPLVASDVVYDLGCGDGRVLQVLYEKEPLAKYVGVEYDAWAACCAKVRTWNTPITILYDNFFSVDLSAATVLTLYLFPSVLDALLPKLEQELRRGTRVYSVDFQFTHKQPLQVITIDESARRGKCIFVYEM